MTPRITVSKGEGITIAAPVDATLDELLDAARRAHQKAQRRLHPGRNQVANEMRFRASSPRASGATWPEITAELEKLLERDGLDERQVRRWAERWERISEMFARAAAEGRLKADT